MMIDPSWLVIRAEASNAIGTGHVMRMIALAQAWMDHHGRQSRVTFAVCAVPEALRKRIQDEGMEVWNLHAEPGGAGDAAELLARFSGESRGPSWIAADGYFFSIEFQRTLRASGQRLLIMDDNGEIGRYDCNLILNQNIMAGERMYPACNADVGLLLGTRYCLLRREFRTAAGHLHHKVVDQVRNVIITLGGSDTSEMVKEIIRALSAEQEKMHIRCIMGSLTAEMPELQSVTEGSRHDVEILHNVRDMTIHMKWADLSINAAGSTTWELCSMSVPMILLVLADNQREIAVMLDRMGCAKNAGDWNVQLTPNRVATILHDLVRDTGERSRMVAKARELVDGQGANRVVEAMLLRSRAVVSA